MTVTELVKKLSYLPEDTQVMILDSSNGGGIPRELNLVGLQRVSVADAEETADCEGLIGDVVIVLGYGCY